MYSRWNVDARSQDGVESSYDSPPYFPGTYGNAHNHQFINEWRYYESRLPLLPHNTRPLYHQYFPTERGRYKYVDDYQLCRYYNTRHIIHLSMLLFSLELLQNKRYTTTQPGSESTYTAFAFDAESTNGINVNHRVQDIITNRQSANNFDNCSKVFMIQFFNSLQAIPYI